jgi:hypothetical protein
MVPSSKNPAPMLADLIAHDVVTLDVCPFPEMWGFNPSIIRRADGTWLCSVRCANYHMAGGVAHVDPSGVVNNRNVMVTLDPATFSPIASVEMCEIDDRPRRYLRCVGYEDLRLVETARDGLCAVATAMQLNTAGKQEIVVLSLDADYQIVRSQPLRGSWSDDHQKNWTPYQGTDELRLVYSLERGGIYDRGGPIIDPHHLVSADDPVAAPDLPEHLAAAWLGPEPALPIRKIQQHRVGAAEVRMMNAAPRMNRPGAGTQRVDHFPLRGGSQLTPLDSRCAGAPAGSRADAIYLGIGHGMRIVGTFKFYWHVFYTMNEDGQMLAKSRPFKISASGIEFCAGLALDPAPGPGFERVVISFGTEDHDAHLGVMNLHDVLGLLEPIAYRSHSTPPRRPLTRTASE